MGVRWRQWALVVAVAWGLGAGCSNAPVRFQGTDTGTPVDTGARDTGGADDASDGGADVRDATGDRRDGTSDALDDAGDAGDADLDAGDAARDGALVDIPPESTVRSCRTNDECGSAALYCNGPGCGTAGFCTPRPDPVSCPGATADGGMSDGGADGGDAGGSSSADQVCGCDGMSYPNLCSLQVAGARLRAFGACPRD